MRYEHITEEQEFKFGPSKQFNTMEEVEAHVAKVREKIITNLAESGFSKSVESIEEEKIHHGIRLKVVIRYPINIFS